MSSKTATRPVMTESVGFPGGPWASLHMAALSPRLFTFVPSADCKDEPAS